MYAVVRTGGKQEKVVEGQTLEVELLGASEGDVVELEPVLVADAGQVAATPQELEGASVRARLVGRAKGPKVVGFTYKPKTNHRRRFGHRQAYSLVEVTEIRPPRSLSAQAGGD
jgi:large subunit ribosomal protein L21